MNLSKKQIYTIVGLISFYILCQAVADVGATTLVQIGKYAVPGGVFVFAFTFTLRDMIHKRLGKQWAQAAIITAALLNIFQSGYFYFIAKLPMPAYIQTADAWRQIFSIVPAITIASILGEVVGESIDTEIYHRWTKRFPTFPQWTRVIVSNAISLPVDSLIFVSFAFYILPPLFGSDAGMPISVMLSIIGGQIFYKAIITVISIPGIYLVKEKKILETN